MAINKQKVLETALKFVDKGQTDKAIKEYLKIVEEDPRDVRIWLKIGDLYARKGSKADATQTYQRVAEFYGEQGFYLKAVAVYKQILKLDPRLIEINLKLADVYRKLGLLSDAIQQYEVVAAYYHREGKAKEALATIRELCELDPENVATRIKLAELYSKEGMTGSAVVEFGRAADHLRVQGRTEDFIKVAERLVWHQPDNVPVNRELARLYLQRNDPRHALQKLQTCFKSDPRDVDTLELLASAFLALGQKSKTVSVWREIAHVHQEAGRMADAGNTFRKVLSVEPADPEALAAMGGGGAAAVGTGTHAAAPARAPQQKRFLTTGAIDIYNVAAVGSEPLVESPFMDAPGDATFDVEQRSTEQSPQLDDIEELGTLVRETRPSGDSSDIELAVDELGELGDDTLMQDAHAEQLGKILDEADVYVKYGLTPKAIAHLQRVFDIDPRNVEARERLKDIYAGLDQREQAANELVKLVDLVAPVNAEQADAYLRELISFDGDEGRARTLATRHRLRLPELRAPGRAERRDVGRAARRRRRAGGDVGRARRGGRVLARRHRRGPGRFRARRGGDGGRVRPGRLRRDGARRRGAGGDGRRGRGADRRRGARFRRPGRGRLARVRGRPGRRRAERVAGGRVVAGGRGRCGPDGAGAIRAAESVPQRDRTDRARG